MWLPHIPQPPPTLGYLLYAFQDKTHSSTACKPRDATIHRTRERAGLTPRPGTRLVIVVTGASLLLAAQKQQVEERQ